MLVDIFPFTFKLSFSVSSRVLAAKSSRCLASACSNCISNSASSSRLPSWNSSSSSLASCNLFPEKNVKIKTSFFHSLTAQLKKRTWSFNHSLSLQVFSKLFPVFRLFLRVGEFQFLVARRNTHSRLSHKDGKIFQTQYHRKFTFLEIYRRNKRKAGSIKPKL